MSKLLFTARLAGLVLVAASGPLAAAPPRNVIFMIGDGMGLPHVQAGGMYLAGSPGTLSFEALPWQARVTTFSADSSVTDSAAAATAMATGHKVNNGVIAMAYPGDGRELTGLLEVYKALGARTGIVTSDAMTGATPAAFGAHEPDRSRTTPIAADFLTQTRPNVLLGGGGSGITPAGATSAGYSVVSSAADLLAVNADAAALLSGQFGNGSMPYEYDGVGNLPHLSQMVATALDILDAAPQGFFLIVESGNIDHAAHARDIARTVFDVIEFHNTVQVALNWAAGRTDTLIVVTADHETGGLAIQQNNGQGSLPTVTWSTTGHTGANVGAWAWGVNAERVSGTIDNTQYFEIVVGADPILAVSPLEVSQDAPWAQNLPADAVVLNVRNVGPATLAYRITSDAAWVTPSPESGTCAQETDTIQLLCDTDDLDAGTYVAHLSVTSDDAPNSPRGLTLTLTVEPIPGDFDNDGDVDQEDFGHLQTCFGQPGSVAPGCRDADVDRDGGVGPADFTIVQKCWSGPNFGPSRTCVQ